MNGADGNESTDMNVGEFFSDGYVDASKKFRDACLECGVGSWSIEHPSEVGPKGETLAVDVAVFGSTDASNMALVNIGTHGIEAYCGSAIAIKWIKGREYERLDENVGVLFVHGLNPWGFANYSRTTENNVDLNRNFVDHAAAYPENQRYANLHETICPKDWSKKALDNAQRQLAHYADRHGQHVMMDALLRGQYSHQDGMNYGGAQREWSNSVLERICNERLSHVQRLGFIDWHTGIGDHGEAVFLCFNEDGGDLQRRAGEWWGADNVAPDAAFEALSELTHGSPFSNGFYHGTEGVRLVAPIVE